MDFRWVDASRGQEKELAGSLAAAATAAQEEEDHHRDRQAEKQRDQAPLGVTQAFDFVDEHVWSFLSQVKRKQRCGSHPLPPFAFEDEFVPGNGKNRPSPVSLSLSDHQ
jgi:hypothetical protein